MRKQTTNQVSCASKKPTSKSTLAGYVIGVAFWIFVISIVAIVIIDGLPSRSEITEGLINAGSGYVGVLIIVGVVRAIEVICKAMNGRRSKPTRSGIDD